MTKTLRWCARVAGVVAFYSVLPAQPRSFNYPQPRKADTSDSYFGTKVSDPYRWMEDLNASALKKCIDAENAITYGYVDGLPARDRSKARITELYNDPPSPAPTQLR